jgi:hypothetical protein
MRYLSPLAVCALTLAVAACTTAPKQTVELADVVGQQIAQMQASHEKFVRLYYKGLRQDVDEFMQQKWTPQFLDNVVSGQSEGGKEFRDSLDRAYRLANVDWKSAVKIEGIEDPEVRKAAEQVIAQLAIRERGQLGQVLLDFATEAQKQINQQRQKLIQPIDAQEAYVLDRLREGYAQLQAGSAAIKGYLASVANVAEQRDAVLQKMGVLEAERKAVSTAINVDDKAMEALNSGKTAKDGVESFLKQLSTLRDQIKQ